MNQEPLDLLSAFTDAVTGEPVTAYEQLDQQQQRQYALDEKFHLADYEFAWQDVLMGYVKYQFPNFVNGSQVTSKMGSAESPLYIYPAFMDSGKQHSAIEYNKKFHVQSFISQFRNEPIPLVKNIKKDQNKQRYFNIKKSVFSKCEDEFDQSILEKCWKFDFEQINWLDKAIKMTKEESQQLKESLMQNYELLKDVHTNYESKAFPHFTFDNFIQLCHD
jgi:hypothetical protein